MLKPYYGYDQDNSPINPMDVLILESTYLHNNLKKINIPVVTQVLVNNILSCTGHDTNQIELLDEYNKENQIGIAWFNDYGARVRLEAFHELIEQVLEFEEDKQEAVKSEERIGGWSYESVA